MDCASIINLELISNAKTNDSKHCLYGVLNNTKTIVGGNLLQQTYYYFHVLLLTESE